MNQAEKIAEKMWREMGSPYPYASVSPRDRDKWERLAQEIITEVQGGEDPTKNQLGKFRRTDPSTSRRAAQFNYPRSGSQRHKVLTAIIMAGDFGATATEIENVTGIPFRSLTPRVGELKNGGWIVSTDLTRTGSMGAEQSVLRATPKAYNWSHKHDGKPPHRDDTAFDSMFNR